MTDVQKIIVLYHANCLDGFTAAWVAWKKFGDNAVYIPVKHGDEPPEEVFKKDQTIYMLDFFSYPKETIERILETSGKLIVIDHHISTKELLTLADEYLFDNKESGASLSWKYFYPDKKMPRLIQYVMENDIWKFETPNTKEIIKVLSIEDFEFESWNNISTDLENENIRKEYIINGKLLAKNSDKEIERIMEGAVEIEFEGYKCFAVNSPVHMSNIGNELFEKSGTLGLVWAYRGDRIVVSLRSGVGGVDVSEIATRHSGGGHKYAAGFSIKESEFLDLNKLFNKLT